MNPLFTPTEFENAKSRDLLPLECKSCHVTFTVSKNEIQKFKKREKEKNPRRNSWDYCSKKCSYVGQHNGVTKPCFQCGNLVYRTPRDLAKTKHSFCSSSCSATWNNNHKTWGNRRSKLEMWLEKELPIMFPNLHFTYNTRKEINGELDIYIPSLKLAFELNGIFHYEPIYGNDNFEKVKRNDNRKFQNCILSNISLCIIDVTSQKRFTPDSSKKFLDIIVNVINEHIKNMG